MNRKPDSVAWYPGAAICLGRPLPAASVQSTRV